MKKFKVVMSIFTENDCTVKRLKDRIKALETNETWNKTLVKNIQVEVA